MTLKVNLAKLLLNLCTILFKLIFNVFTALKQSADSCCVKIYVHILKTWNLFFYSASETLKIMKGFWFLCSSQHTALSKQVRHSALN